MVDTTFLDEVASAAPTPGGGGAAAYGGALAAALASMVANLTAGKKTYAAVENDVQDSLSRLEDLRAQLIALINKDAQAFAPLAATYKIPKETEEEKASRNAAMQAALVGACEVPLDTMRTSHAVIDEIDFLAHNGSKLARSDAGAAATFARAAVEAASLNIFINVASMDDKIQAARYREEASRLADEARTRCDNLFAFIVREVS